MTAPAHMAAVTVAALDLDDRSLGAAESTGCRGGHCRGRQGWSKRKCAGGKSDQQKPLHGFLVESQYRDRERMSGEPLSSIELSFGRGPPAYGVQPIAFLQDRVVVRAMSASGPDCLKRFFSPKNCTQPGTIRVDTTA